MPISSLRPRVLASLLALGAIGAAQAFPDGATTPSASALAQHLNDRVFGTALADGTALRIEFKSSGYLFIDTSRGRNLKGEWRAEDGRLCAKMNGDDACNDARFHEGLLFIKRAINGEVIRYQPK